MNAQTSTGPLLSGTAASHFTTAPAACETAIIGGGPGGVYSAFRLLEGRTAGSSRHAASNGTSTEAVCLFEATNRVGGRVYSVRNMGDKRDLTVDMGAYRYNRKRMGIITDIIERLLQLPTRVYQPGDPDYHIIERPDGTAAGFTTYVEGLLTRALDQGLNITFNARVVAVDERGSGFQLRLANGKTVSANRVIMNLPLNPLHRLLANSDLPRRIRNPQLYAPYQITAGKVYLYYPQAWWIAQNLTTTDFIDSPVWPPVQVPFSGRFYDGEVRCPKKGASNNRTTDFKLIDFNTFDVNACYGFLEVFYEAEHGPLDVYYPEDRSYQPFAFLADFAGSSDPNVPYFIQTNLTPDGRWFLNTAHTRLVNYLREIGYDIPASVAKQAPTQAVVALWNEAVPWAGAGWHDWKDSNYSTVAKVASSVQPFPELDLYLANEAFAEYQHWSEGSLTMAENVVRQHFNVSVPTWMRPSTAQGVIFNSSYNEFQGPEE